MRHILFSAVFLVISIQTHADTINNYMGIANNIPKMEMKADREAQAWVRSARNILSLTSESIAESLMLANEANPNKPIFCLPQGKKITEAELNTLIQKTYQDLAQQNLSDINTMTVSQVALIGLKKQYPCEQQTTLAKQLAPFAHVSGNPNQ